LRARVSLAGLRERFFADKRYPVQRETMRMSRGDPWGNDGLCRRATLCGAEGIALMRLCACMGEAPRRGV